MTFTGTELGSQASVEDGKEYSLDKLIALLVELQDGNAIAIDPNGKIAIDIYSLPSPLGLQEITVDEMARTLFGERTMTAKTIVTIKNGQLEAVLSATTSSLENQRSNIGIAEGSGAIPIKDPEKKDRFLRNLYDLLVNAQSE